jgi:phosphopantetheine adenylyltransferase
LYKAIERQLYKKGETIQKHRIHKIEKWKTRKQTLKRILKNRSSNEKITKEVNNNDTTYCTEPAYSYITVNQ